MITIGTAGYSYQDWVGPFYPPGLSKGKWLEFYGKQFSFTEVNSSFYRMPTSHMLARMAERTPSDFKFAIKAYRGITHDSGSCAEDCRALAEAVKPLVEAGKLACLLVQFPTSYHNTGKTAATWQT